MGHDHTATAIPLKLQLVHSITIGHILLVDELQVAFPEVANDLPTGKAPHRDNHGVVESLTICCAEYWLPNTDLRRHRQGFGELTEKFKASISL